MIYFNAAPNLSQHQNGRQQQCGVRFLRHISLKTVLKIEVKNRL
jgi:hypothetical protein